MYSEPWLIGRGLTLGYGSYVLANRYVVLGDATPDIWHGRGWYTRNGAHCITSDLLCVMLGAL